MTAAARPGWRWGLAGLATFAACFATAAPASSWPAPQAVQDLLRSAEAARAPLSPLVSDQDLPVGLSTADWQDQRLTMLRQDTPGQPPRLLALVARPRGLFTHSASYRWFPSAGTPEWDLAALEHLYRFAINDAVTDSFHFETGEPGSAAAPASNPPLTHAELLARIATARRSAADAIETAGRSRLKRWETVVLQAPPGDPEARRVMATIRNGQGPVAGATILFSRAPHFECTARSDDAGLASCELEDTYGHEHDPQEFAGAPTVASYPGEIRVDVIVLPTTAVDRNAAAAATARACDAFCLTIERARAQLPRRPR